jgi:hypothetical protein
MSRPENVLGISALSLSPRFSAPRFGLQAKSAAAAQSMLCETLPRPTSGREEQGAFGSWVGENACDVDGECGWYECSGPIPNIDGQ